MVPIDSPAVPNPRPRPRPPGAPMALPLPASAAADARPDPRDGWPTWTDGPIPFALGPVALTGR